MKKYIKIIPLLITIFAFMSLWFLGGCGDDGSTSFISPTGATGATGATGSTDLHSLRVNVSHAGQAVTGFSIALNRTGSTASSSIEGSDSSGQGWYEFDNLFPGDYKGTITSDEFETRYFDVTVPVTGNEVSFTMGQWNAQGTGLTGTPNYEMWLSGISFGDSTAGWAVGGDYHTNTPVITHTSDGETWAPQTPASDPNYPYGWLNDVSFADSTTGWAVGNKTNGSYDDPMIMNTTDGSTWNVQTVPDVIDPNTTYTDEELLGVDFINTTTGWAVGHGSGTTIILNTTDGSTWNIQTPPSDPNCSELYDVDFVDSQNGWAVGSGILHTSDGGNTWTNQLPSYGYNFRCVHFIDSSRGWTAGYRTGIYTTTDGGTTWERTATEALVSYYIDSIYFTDEYTGWVTESSNNLAHKDIYSDWTEQHNIQGVGTPYLLDLFFIDSQNGWAAGYAGDYPCIIHYTE